MLSRDDPCLVNRAIRSALRDAESVLIAKDVVVTANLDATWAFDDAPAALYESLYTIFRGLPERSSRGSTLWVATQDRAGGDIEVAWEAREDVASSEDAHLREVVRGGPYGDLLELAILGLERAYGGRTSQSSALQPPPHRGAFQESGASWERRFVFLLPDPRRQRYSP